MRNELEERVKVTALRGHPHLLRSTLPELFLSRDGELRDIQEEFSAYVRYMLRSLVQNFIFQSLSMSLFPNLLLEPDPYSNAYLVAKIGVGRSENELTNAFKPNT